MFSVIRKYRFIILIFFLSLGVISPLFKTEFFAAHDAVWHIARFWQFHLSFSSGQIPVRWAPTLFYGLGYPAFIVNFHLPYYLMEIIYRLGFGLVDTYKIVLGLSVITSGFFAFLFLRSIFPTLPAVVGSLFFIYSPYRFATLYARGAIGEALAIAIVPLVFWSLELFRKNKSYGGFLFAISLFLLIIAHPVIFLMFTPLIFLYLFLFSKAKIEGIFWFLIGCIASSFTILPYFFERKYLMIDDVYKNVFWGHFPNLFAILRIPAFGADLGSPFQIGIVHWITALLSIIAFLKFRRNLNKIDKLFLISTVFFFIGLFFMSRASIVLWQNLPLLSTILFPWRFLNLLVFSSAVASAYLIFKLRNNKLVSLILIVAVIYVSRHWWGWVGQIPTSDKYYKDYQETTTDEGEFTPRGISPEIMNHASVNIEILSGATRISNEKLTNNHWQFDTLVLKNSTVKMAILDFPGWKVKINNRDGEIIKNFKNQNGDYSGLIVVNLPEGNYKVEVIFGETRLRILADYLTLASLILIMGLILKRYHAQNR